MHIFVIAVSGAAAEWARARRRSIAHRQQGRHVDADKRLRLHSDEVGQRTVHAQDVAGFVVGHNEIADGVEDLDPVPVGLVHAGKQAGIFQRHRGVPCDGLQDLVVFVHPLFAVSEEQNADQFSRRAQQSHQGAVAFTQLGGQRGTEQLRRRGGDNRALVSRQGLFDGMAEASQQ